MLKNRVSVIVVTYNRPKDVKAAVESLLNQSVKPFEIIVIDNGSYPPASLESSVNLKIFRFDQEAGLSNARNYGINIAKGEYIAFIDDDGIAEKTWVEEIQKGLENADIVGGTIKPLYEVAPPEWWTEKDFGKCVGVGNILVKNKSKIWGGNMAFKPEVFKAIGLFNPNLGRRKGKLFASEENDLIDRARRKGFNV
ncbi:glycosyltransferase family 2 protein, partial [Candidatus Bathyarchaeota archaeon]|nr:glycosyltransferase family 2 protein [Candidatus Bathyarchaeota archaeon]